MSDSEPIIPERLTRPMKAKLVVEILLGYGRARWALARHPLPKALELLRRPGRRRNARSGDEAILVGGYCGWLVMRTLDRLPTDDRCLMRSLVLTWMLARRGLASQFVIGVRPGASVPGHAWVERDGLALLPPERDSFTRLVTL